MNLVEQYKKIKLTILKRKLILTSNELFRSLCNEEDDIIYTPDYSYRLSEKKLKLEQKINTLQKRN